MSDIISWAATVTTIIAACMTASNLGSRVTGWGFVVFTLGALLWIATGLMTHQPALIWSNVVLTVLDLFGIWRWLGRQAKVEEGAHAAAQASRQARGETLFPVSMLTSARVECEGEEVGSAVDAMAGCGSGALAYLVVSEGGVAGVGETLRRLPWSTATVQDKRIVTHLRRSEFAQLETLAKDHWPAR